MCLHQSQWHVLQIMKRLIPFEKVLKNNLRKGSQEQVKEEAKCLLIYSRIKDDGIRDGRSWAVWIDLPSLHPWRCGAPWVCWGNIKDPQRRVTQVQSYQHGMYLIHLKAKAMSTENTELYHNFRPIGHTKSP